jgi:hypothetical protein
MSVLCPPNTGKLGSNDAEPTFSRGRCRCQPPCEADDGRVPTLHRRRRGGSCRRGCRSARGRASAEQQSVGALSRGAGRAPRCAQTRGLALTLESLRSSWLLLTALPDRLISLLLPETTRGLAGPWQKRRYRRGSTTRSMSDGAPRSTPDGSKQKSRIPDAYFAFVMTLPPRLPKPPAKVALVFRSWSGDYRVVVYSQAAPPQALMGSLNGASAPGRSLGSG